MIFKDVMEEEESGAAWELTLSRLSSPPGVLQYTSNGSSRLKESRGRAGRNHFLAVFFEEKSTPHG